MAAASARLDDATVLAWCLWCSLGRRDCQYLHRVNQVCESWTGKLKIAGDVSSLRDDDLDGWRRMRQPSWREIKHELFVGRLKRLLLLGWCCGDIVSRRKKQGRGNERTVEASGHRYSGVFPQA